MNLFDSYLFLFFDSLVAAILLPIRSESAVHAMIIFNQYNPYLIFIITLSASSLGSMVNWWVGKKLIFLQNKDFLKGKKPQIKHAELKWDRYIIWSLIFASLKIFGNPMSLLAGFLRTSIKKFLLLIVSGKAIYYIYLINF
jgi:membrane protein YqaA with SNARE-associated domain